MVSKNFKNYRRDCYINPMWYLLTFIIFVVVIILVIVDSADSSDNVELSKNPKIISAIVLGSIGMVIMLMITIRDNSDKCIKAKSRYKKYKPPNIFTRMKNKFY